MGSERIGICSAATHEIGSPLDKDDTLLSMEGSQRDTCYYDGLCGMCRRSTRALRRLDWLGRLEFKDMTTVPVEDLPVGPDSALTGMPMRTRDGRALIGFPAVRRAALQTPLLFLGALLLYLPVVSWVGDAVYRRIAAARRRDGTCVLPQHGVSSRHP